MPLPDGNASEGKWWKGVRGKKKRKGRGNGEKIRKSETEALARPLAGEGWGGRSYVLVIPVNVFHLILTTTCREQYYHYYPIIQVMKTELSR